MGSAEPKSGRLYKFGQGLLGSKWTEKWVHLDGAALKYFSMASEQQPLFSLTSARQSCVVELAAYDVAEADDKRLNRKHAFQLIPRNKASKSYVFACSNEKELGEWMDAFKARTSPGANVKNGVSPLVAAKLRRAAEAFSACDPRRTDKVDATKLRVLLQSVGWQGDVAEYSMLQQQLDPNVDGKITRDRYLRAMKQYFSRRESLASEHERGSKLDDDCVSPRSSFSDRPSATKSQAHTEPDQDSDADVIESNPKNDSSAEASQGQPDPHEHNQAHETTVVETPRDWQAEYVQLQKQSTLESTEDVIRGGLEFTAFLSEFRMAAEDAVVHIVQKLLGFGAECGTYSRLPLDGDQFLATDYSDEYEAIRRYIAKYASSGLLIYLTQDETASVILGHQIRAARVLHEALRAVQSSSQSVSIELPLQCVVDYIGFRAVVFPQPSKDVCRLRSSRLLAGCDAKTTRDILATLECALTQVGIFTGDLVGDASVSRERLPDYVGQDAGVDSTTKFSLTLHNVFSLFPLDPALGGRVYSQFRPEFVAEYGSDIPLRSSTHNTGVSMNPLSSGILDEAGSFASEYLQNVVIPQFVVRLEAQSAHVYDSATFTAALHRAGINARYLAICYEQALANHTKRLILSEVIARTVKKLLRSTLRALSGTSQAVHQHPEHMGSRLPDVNCVVTELFNLVFSVGSVDSKHYWSHTIIPTATSSFNMPRAAFESFPDSCSDDQLHWPQLLLAVFHHTNVTAREIDELKLGSTDPFTAATRIAWSPRVKMPCRTSHQCEALISGGEHMTTAPHLDTVLAHTTITSATPSDERSPSLGFLFARAAELHLELSERSEAEQTMQLALEAVVMKSATRAWVLLGLIKIMKEQGKSIQEMLSAFDEAVSIATWHLGSSHPVLHSLHLAMAEIAGEAGAVDESSRCFSAAAQIIKDCYGRSSLLYADTRRLHAELLIQKSAELDHASIVLDEAFTIYDEAVRTTLEDGNGIREMKANAASCLFMLAHVQASSNDKSLDTAYSTAVRAHSMRVEALPAGHCDVLSSALQLGEICQALGDSYRALEFYRSALTMLKTAASADGQEAPAQLKRISQTIVNLHLQTLSAEKLTIVDRTRKRFTDLTLRLEAAAAAIQDGVSLPEEVVPRLLLHVVRLLLQQDLVECVNDLLERAEREMHALRRQSFALTTGRHDSSAAEAPASPSCASPLSSPLSSSSRFASFAYGQPPQLTPRPASPLPQAQRGGLGSPSLRLSTASDHPNASVTTETGEFSSGAQLATVLFLAQQV